MAYADGQRLYYDTEMVPAGTSYFTPHSAFADPTVGPDAPPRFSIELRIVCLDL